VPTAPGRRPRWPRPVAIACAAAALLAGGVVAAVALDGDPATPPAAADLAVPSVRGDQVRAARAELEAAGFDVAVRRVPGGRAAGLVLTQRPASGPYDGDLPATVTLTVASGPQQPSATPSPTATAEPVAAPAEHPAAHPKAEPKTKGPKPKAHGGPKGPAKKPGKGHGKEHGNGHGPKHHH
jgi:hypothetical protein